MKYILSFLSIETFFSLDSLGLTKVVASTADIAALAREVGGDKVQVVAIAKGSQDPHFVEAKPSFMVKLRDADLLVSNGMSLEVGWLPSLIRGARNPKIAPGSSGYLELASFVEGLDKPAGNVTRAMGDVHPEGNPHFMLDPIIVGDLAAKIADKLGILDPSNKDKFSASAKSYHDKLSKMTTDWRSRIEKSGVKKVITYHPSLNYFLKRFGFSAPLHVEAKPGVPPSAQHVLEIISTMKKENIGHILVDNFFDTKIAERISKDVPNSKVISVGISVNSLPELKKLEDVTEQIIRAIEAQ